MGVNKDRFWMYDEYEDDYPDTDELEYQDKIQTSKRRDAKIAKQDRNQANDLDHHTTKRDKKNDKKI